MGRSPHLNGAPRQASTAPQPHAYPQQPQAYPQQPHAYPQQPQAYPQQPHAYPQQPQAYPQQPQAYPQQPQAYPQQPQAYPQQPQAYPQQPQAYPPQQVHPSASAQAPSSPAAAPLSVDMAALARHVAAGVTAPASTASPDPEPYPGNHSLTAAGDVVAVFAACEAIHQADKVAERKRPLLGWAAIACAVLAFGSFFAGQETDWAAPLGIGFGIACIVFAVWWNIVRRIDIEDRKLDVVVGTLATFAYELALKKPVSVHLEFRDHAKARATTTEQVAGSTVETFEHPWLRLGFTLADGTELCLENTTLAKRKSRRKRKYTKIRERYHELLRITLHPPRGHAFATSTPAPSPGVTPCEGLRLRRARFQPGAARFEFLTSEATRLRARSGWSGSNSSALLTRQKVVAAITCSYKLASQGVPR